MNKYLISILSCFLTAVISLSAQQKDPLAESETVDMPYIHVLRASAATSAAYRLESPGFSIHQVNVDANGQNILNDAGNEPSIAVDYTNPSRMVIGWRQFETITSNFRQAGYAFSLDGGNSWDFPEPLEAGIFRSDPVLDVDVAGNFFYSSLQNDQGSFFCHVFKSPAGTTSFEPGVYAYGGDKQWMVVDRTNTSSQGNMYSFWKDFYSICPPGSFTRSVDFGDSWESCATVPGSPQRGTMAIGPDGELYVCGNNSTGFVVLKSTSAAMAGTPVNWEQNIPVNLDGQIGLYQGPNPQGMLGQAWVQVDQSEGVNRGNVYLLATIEGAFNGAASDVVFSRSTDGGLTWDAALHLNGIDPDFWQWFGTLSVAPTGRVDITWLDTRNTGTYDSQLFYTYSNDGGITWSDQTALSESFNPLLGFPSQQKIGDYYHQVSDSLGVHLTWAATFNGEEDIYYSYIQPEVLPSAVSHSNQQQQQVRVHPSPFSDATSFRFSLEKTAEIRLSIYNTTGQLVHETQQGKMPAGSYNLPWATTLPAGIYYWQVLADGQIMGAGKVVKQ